MSFYGFNIWQRTFTWSVSRPAEVQPWEVRFAHPCLARARHPIHKAMGGHASHGRASDRVSSHFNSVRVQLKHYGRARLYPVCFSIPSGAIRTQQRQMIEIDKHSRFNSIMVQLEHLRVDTVYVLMRNPQISHMLNFPLHIEASYSLLIRSTNSSGVSISIFEKPNHFLPKSLMDAPM